MKKKELIKEKVEMQGISNIEVTLSDLIKKKYTKIVATSPVNPSIKKDDEWRTETCWDTDYKELKK